MKKVLMLAYYYPPSGGAGVQRTAKFVRYLPEFGYSPIVVAGRGRDGKSFVDLKLAKEVEDAATYNIKFSKSAQVLDRFFQGPLGGWTNCTMLCWINSAGKAVERAIEKEKPDILYATASPFQAAKVMSKAARKFNLPWVLDLRDPWALDPITQYRTKLHCNLALKNMEQACREADAVIVNTPDALEAVKNIFDDIDQGKFRCVTNGWDSNDFNGMKSTNNRPKGALKIVHTGMFHTNNARRYNRDHLLRFLRYSVCRTNLMARSAYYLFEARKSLVDKQLIEPGDIEFYFAGVVTNEDRALVEKYDLNGLVRFEGYLNHESSIKLLNEGDVLFLPLHETDNSHKPLIVPGKAYEYMASEKPILACVPKGDTNDFIKKSGLGYLCDPTNVKQIAETLLCLVKQHKTQSCGIKTSLNKNFIDQFERKQLTGKLADIFDSIESKRTTLKP